MTLDVNRFLPVSIEDMRRRGWDNYDFLLVTGDAYVDHPAFGAAVIGRVLEKEGFRVAVLAQPGWRDASAFTAMGRPNYGVLIGAGNLDSMVAHYTAAKRKRSEDFYSPGKKAGLRPDRAVLVYSNLARQAFPGLPVIIGGLEASLRRFAHYDYWDDKVRRSILPDAKADLLCFGMGERSMAEIARRLAGGHPLDGIPGTARMVSERPDYALELPSYEEVCAGKEAYARSVRMEYDEHDPIRGHALAQKHGNRWLLAEKPDLPLSAAELDEAAELPYTREAHPMYDSMGGVPAVEEVRFSVTHNRGCFGGCNFCALAYHQGRMVTSRSHESVIREVEAMTRHPLWKGYVSDVGGPTANFRQPSCKKQLKHGMCPNKSCLAPQPCPNLEADESDYTALLRKLRALPGVKKVFVRSGVRYDYTLRDKSGAFLRELTEHHISGQLRVAPEHCVDSVLWYMGKPPIEVYNRFMEKYEQLNSRLGKNQYAVPYLMSSHPGSTLNHAIRLAEYLKAHKLRPEQVQDFYPTPGTMSTCMYYTGLDPRTMKPVYTAKSEKEKAMQRALLQYYEPRNHALVLQALRQAGREDLIGTGPRCLVSEQAPRKAPKLSASGNRPTGAETRKAPKPRRGQTKSPTAKKSPRR